MITKNAIKCKHCGDIIESTHVHDFKWCSCKKVAVDGGNHYLRRLGNQEDWEELSETKVEYCGTCEYFGIDEEGTFCNFRYTRMILRWERDEDTPACPTWRPLK